MGEMMRLGGTETCEEMAGHPPRVACAAHAASCINSALVTSTGTTHPGPAAHGIHYLVHS
jgi:hypothetical protein